MSEQPKTLDDLEPEELEKKQLEAAERFVEERKKKYGIKDDDEPQPQSVEPPKTRDDVPAEPEPEPEPEQETQPDTETEDRKRAAAEQEEESYQAWQRWKEKHADRTTRADLAEEVEKLRREKQELMEMAMAARGEEPAAPPEPSQPPQDETPPDPYTDPDAWLDYRLKKTVEPLLEAEKRRQQAEQQTTVQSRQNQMQDALAQEANAYNSSEEGAGYFDRYQRWVKDQKAKYVALGLHPQEAMQTVAQDLGTHAARAAQLQVPLVSYFDQSVLQPIYGRGGSTQPASADSSEIEQMKRAAASGNAQGDAGYVPSGKPSTVKQMVKGKEVTPDLYRDMVRQKQEKGMRLQDAIRAVNREVRQLAESG